jgi:hypothetical protein
MEVSQIHIRRELPVYWLEVDFLLSDGEKIRLQYLLALLLELSPERLENCRNRVAQIDGSSPLGIQALMVNRFAAGQEHE